LRNFAVELSVYERQGPVDKVAEGVVEVSVDFFKEEIPREVGVFGFWTCGYQEEAPIIRWE